MTGVHRLPDLSDPHAVAALAEQMADRDDLGAATALIVLCDERWRPRHQVKVVDCDPEPTPSDCDAVLSQVTASRLAVGADWRLAGLAVALTRAGGEEVQPYDRAWLRALHRVCHRSGLRPLGVHVVTRTGTRAVQIDDAA
jgi:hypothetical protein